MRHTCGIDFLLALYLPISSFSQFSRLPKTLPLVSQLENSGMQSSARLGLWLLSFLPLSNIHCKAERGHVPRLSGVKQAQIKTNIFREVKGKTEATSKSYTLNRVL